jgi:hypothetical protein
MRDVGGLKGSVGWPWDSRVVGVVVMWMGLGTEMGVG